MSPTIRVLTTADAAAWDSVIASLGAHDVYHLASYHRVAELAGEGSARLFVYETTAGTIALPLLLRPVAEVAGLAELGADWCDATSVYGYPGPLTSSALPSAEVIRGFQASLAQSLREARVITVFSRLHPLMEQRHLLAGSGEIIPGGQTVSMDLTLPLAEQNAQIRSDHRRDISHLRSQNLTCIHDHELQHFDRFIALYLETMRQVRAADGYFFGRSYFENLAAQLGEHLRLFVCLREGEMISGGLVFVCQGIVQGHLSGTDPQHRKLASHKLLYDAIRQWAMQHGCRRFHLGGGVGAGKDTLFDFKAGFSKVRHEFFTWRWVLEPEVYATLGEAKARWNAGQGLETASAYFPSYRAPGRAAAPISEPA